MNRKVSDRNRLYDIAPILLITLLLTFQAPLGATLIDWEDGTWVHGAVTRTGYLNGSLTGTTTVNGLTATVTWTNFGTSTGTYASMGGAQPTVRTEANGGFNGVSTDGALGFGTNADRNTVATGLVNYSQMVITFSTAVSITGFVIGDVDRAGNGSTWEDFLYVEGRAGGPTGTLRTTLYTTSPAYNTLATYLGLNGVRGNSGDAPGSSDLANLGIAFSGQVNYIRLYYFQGPGVTGNSAHRIWFRDVQYTDVPEPSTFALAGIGVVALGLAGRRRRGQAGKRVT